MNSIETLRQTDITPEDSVVPVYLVLPTAKEEAERLQWIEETEKRKEEEIAAAEAKQSGILKLKTLGLTDDEIKALTGSV
jgi:hypothetical protein